MAEQMVLQQLLSEFRKQDEAWDQHTPEVRDLAIRLCMKVKVDLFGFVSWLKLGNRFWDEEMRKIR